MEMLKDLSAEQLETIATKATVLAEQLRKEQPSDELAVLNGVKNNTYHTHAFGWVRSYSGEAIIQMADGTLWKAVGHKPIGGADYIDRQGYIEFFKIRVGGTIL